MVKLDHIVIGCAELAAGEAIMAEKLGPPASAHGKHAHMGTHNALWNMGAYYIELVAIDPEAPDPGRPRWFGLGGEAGAQVADRPRLISWAVSVGDIQATVAAAPTPLGAVEKFARDDLTWNLAVPVDGEPGMSGAYPLTIQWTSGLHPAERLPDLGLRCAALTVTHPDIETVRTALGDVAGPVVFEEGPVALTCLIEDAEGRRIALD